MVSMHSQGATTTPSPAPRPVAWLAGVTLVLVLGGCEKPVVEQKELVRPVKIHTIGEADPDMLREYPGTIRALQHADMGFEVSGRITEFFVLQGDDVVQGEVLARLDPRDYEAEVKAAQANLRKAEADLKRSLSIQKEEPGAISKETIDTHRRAVDVSKAQLAVAQKALDDTQLRAPFSGRMARKLVEDFANVQAKEPVLVLQDTSTLEIEINVPERDVVRREPEQRPGSDFTAMVSPEVIVSALPDRSFEAWVKEFAAAADPVTRTFAVKLNFKNPGNLNILPGMTARVRVITDYERTWSVPVTAALTDESGEAFVWKVDPSTMTVSRAPVKLSTLYEDRVRIESGVEEGDMVAISGVHQLREGLKVRELN